MVVLAAPILAVVAEERLAVVVRLLAEQEVPASLFYQYQLLVTQDQHPVLQ
jgi:hypothetical protein